MLRFAVHTLACSLAVAGIMCAASPARADDVLHAPPIKRTVLAGFRMEGAAELEVVFGDIKRYRAHVDSFYRAHESMDETRTSFYRHVHASLGVLTASKRGRCPVTDLAPVYYHASGDSDAYRKLGANFEAHYVAIRRLHKLGETAGLTPDYRWKVNKVRGMYRATLVDLREMRVAFDKQLSGELRKHRCSARTLIAEGAGKPVLVKQLAINPPPKRRRSRRAGHKTAPITASPVTFFVDNHGCGSTLRVFIDGVQLGDVAADTRGAFQSKVGRHAMCLIPNGSTATCGQTGTVRASFIYDGWSITMHCAAKHARN